MPIATKTLQDMRCGVESVLKSTLVESDKILPRECWMQFLEVIVGSQDTQALLKDQKSQLSVEEFLDIIFGPEEFDAPEVFAVSSAVPEGGEIAWTDNLRDYFQKQYRKGGLFHHPAYNDTCDVELHTWLHRPTGIQIWQDAIDLTSGEGGEVYFHYTSELAFRNITAPAKKAAEAWASLNSDPGPKQNAWWGKGVYSVPLPPDQWRDREQLLDNNFRNMMARDRAAPDKGPKYVEAEYPKRVAFCVPIIINSADAYDVSVRATPEMQAAGKEPGRNLGDKLLNESGLPPPCCVVLRVNGEDGVKHAQGQLFDALRRRAVSCTDPAAKYRLGDVLMMRGLYEEALPVLREVLEIYDSKYGPKSYHALASRTNLAALLEDMDRFGEALELERRSLEGWEAMLGPEHRSTLAATNNLAETLRHLGKFGEALELQRKALELRSRTLGSEHPDTLQSMSNLGLILDEMGSHHEAAELHRKALELRSRTLGGEHPDTLDSMQNVAITLCQMGKVGEAGQLQRKVLEVRNRTLGGEHPETVAAMNNLGLTLKEMGSHDEAAELHRKALEIRSRTLGPEHPQTLQSMGNLGWTLDQMGSHDEAAELQQKTLKIMKRTLGPEHPETLNSITNLGIVLRNLGDFAESEKLLRKALAVNERTLGAEHPQTLETLSELAVTLHRKGELKEAMEMQRRAVSGREKAMGPDHSDTKESRQRLEEVLHDLDLGRKEVEEDAQG